MSPSNIPAGPPPGARLEPGPTGDAPFTGLEDSPSTILNIVSPQHASQGGKDDLSNSMHSHRFHEDDTGKSLPSEAPRDGPPQLLYENLHPDRGDSDENDSDFFPRLDLEIHAVLVHDLTERSSQAYSILLSTADGELPVDIMKSTGVPLTSATLAALGGTCDFDVNGWTWNMYRPSDGPDGVNGRVVGEDVVNPATGSAYLVAVGGWGTVDIHVYPLEVEGALVEDEEGWVVVDEF